MFGTASYSYDVLDNITRATVGTSPTLAARDWYYCYTGNRLSNVKTGSCAGATVIGLEYDVQGNVVNRSGQVYSFDYGNRLRSATGKEWYAYDGHGRRIISCSPMACACQQYSQAGQLLYLSDSRNALRAEQIYLGGSLVAQRQRPINSEVVTVKYQHTDALGSPIATTDANKAFIDKTEYEPYGRQSNRPVVDGPGYTGHVQDAATGLTYMQQRYYDPTIGAFLSVDPVTAYNNPMGMFNRYRYASDNPYRFNDPDGRQTARIHKEDTQEERQAALEERRRRSESSGTLNDGKRKFREGTENQRHQIATTVLARVGATVREHKNNSPDDAAKYFMKVFQPVSTKFGVEFSAEIKGGSGGWYLTNLGVGNRFRSVDGIGFMTAGGIDFGGINSHTHPLEDYSGHWNEPFSTDDILSLRGGESDRLCINSIYVTFQVGIWWPGGGSSMNYRIHKPVRHFPSVFIFLLAGCVGNQVPETAKIRLPADCASTSDNQIVCLTTFDAIYSNLISYDAQTVVLNGFLVIDQGMLSLYASQEAYGHKMTEGNIIVIRASSDVQKDLFDKFGYNHVRVSGKFHASELPPLSRYELGAIKEDLMISELPDRSTVTAREDWSDIRIHVDDLSRP